MAKRVKRDAKHHMHATRSSMSARNHGLHDAHDTQVSELDSVLSKMPKPRMRYSKMMLEFKESEKHLARLERFEEAAELRKQIRLLEPSEHESFEAEFQKKKGKLRAKLAKKQDFETKKMYEKNKDAEYRARQKEEENVRVIERRLKNLETDMNHMHKLEGLKNLEHTIKPVVEKRKNYDSTSAFYFGDQLMSQASGHTQHNIPSLCDLHEFGGDELSGTLTLAE